MSAPGTDGVLLVSMPFGPLFSPSLALSLLKASLAARGIASTARYFSLDFAARLGQDFYSAIAMEARPPVVMLAGEWIFSGGLLPPPPGAADAYVAQILRAPRSASERGSKPLVSEAGARRLVAARALVPDFLDACVAEIVARRPRVLGLTSIFQQHLASLALAKRVKAALPETVIVMGGANVEGIMGAETVRQFPFVDAAVSGEGEVVFPELVTRVLEGGPFDGLAGVRTPAGVAAELAARRFSSAPTVAHMDALPVPDFSDFFAEFEASRWHGEWQPSLYYETSRGCWWGERQHCTFCGLNGSSMAFRSKSAARAVAELESLAREHPGCDVQVVDNILDMGYFRDFLPMLAERRLGVELFYETKSNLRKEQIRALRAAGVTRIQPGVESLSDSVLKVMRKGVSALQNLQLLKWCKELGVEPHWNLLWGFPGEDPAEYARLASLVPSLTHLRPPTGYSEIRLDRFSPNFFDAAALGFENVRPLPSYAHVYPGLPPEVRANLAYFFAFDYQQPRDVAGYVAPAVKELRSWAKAGRRGDADLFVVDVAERLVVVDLRPGAREAIAVLDGPERRLLLACDAATDLRALPAEASFGSLVERGLVVIDGPRALSLAVPLGEYQPERAVRLRFDRLVRRLGTGVARQRAPLGAPLRPADFTFDARGALLVRGATRLTLTPGRPGREHDGSLRRTSLEVL